MTAYTLFESVVIGAIVCWSVWTVLGHLLPSFRRQLLRIAGRREQAAAACDTGCSSCSGCAKPSSGEQTIRFATHSLERSERTKPPSPSVR